MMRRAALCFALGALLSPAVWAHGPSGGGPDDPEASARSLTFDTRLADASQPPDERPLPWVVAGPGTATSEPPARARALRRPRTPVPADAIHAHLGAP
jgi:hypothetical protein